jgi:hypothetical protein
VSMTGPTPFTCAKVGTPNVISIFGGDTPMGGACAPSGGTPTGSVTPTNPTTLCCTP